MIPETVDSEKGSLGIACSRLISVMVNAIKKRQSHIEQLKSHNDELLDRVEALEREE